MQNTLIAKGIKIIDSTIQNKIKNPVAFFDIDLTLIDSQGLLIKPVYELYNYAIKNGIKVVLITARPGFPENFEWTKKQLYDVGIRDYSLLFVRPPDIVDPFKYKLFARRFVVELGHTPIFTIGDMDFDMGDYGGAQLLIS